MLKADKLVMACLTSYYPVSNNYTCIYLIII